MFEVKKYRAATTREALEQVKQELGEQAFVLETKRVQTRGFLGIGGQSQIEISAALPAEAENAAAAPAPKAAKDSLVQLNLTDNSPAVPARREGFGDLGENEILQAINLRESTARSVERHGGALRARLNQPLFGAPKPIETVELSDAAPRFVNPKKEMKKTPDTPPAAEASAARRAEGDAKTISNRDFEMLRAELREVKFTLGAFANRHNVQMWQSQTDFELVDDMFDSPFYEAYTDLIATGISNDLARKIVTDIIPQYRDGKIPAEQLAKTALFKAFSSLIKFEHSPLQTGQPAMLALIGATGVGKTTTVAKLASRVALHERRRVELVTLDTYRIAAVEQLKTYAEIIGAGCSVVRSVFELDAVLRRLPEDASVLIDTTGRSPHDLADQHEIADYLRTRPEIRKCLVTQATAHPIDSFAAVKKFEMYGADCLALTKMDETMRPGAMVELAAQSQLPLIYLCMGQRVPEDLQEATPQNFIAHVFRESNSPRFF